ncbi:MAG: D-tyrosyl-tRNA(Tyr) deacylase [Opitutales bacterium]|nr:D-tyrosyl-tRNA(Tyr) deacylase [Opitutales bacterium]
MRIVAQRVARAQVSVEDQVTGRIDSGLLLFVGIHQDDTEADSAWLADKVPKLRLFEDDTGRMARNVDEAGGGLLVISQFTLFGSIRKGTRPSFHLAAPPERAIPLYETFLRQLRTTFAGPVEAGVFGAMMRIDALNDGPVTLILDSRER